MFFSSLIIFYAAVFPILKMISASFLHPSAGFAVAKFKNLTFSSKKTVFFARLPASRYFDNAMFVNLILELSFSKAIFFSNLHV